jgi:hypothetical protein
MTAMLDQVFTRADTMTPRADGTRNGRKLPVAVLSALQS